jgi:hypothetical protein
MMRRWMIGALSLLLALTVVGWIFYMPSPALNTLKPVPAYAQIVYHADAFGGPILEKFRVSKPWKSHPGFFQTLEKCPLSVAVAPFGGRDRRDTWVAVSALGPRAVFLRWRLAFAPPKGVKQLHSYGAWPVWEYSDSSLPAWMRIRFSVSEGLLICSISDDSHDINYLLDTLDGRRPSAEQKDEQ